MGSQEEADKAVEQFNGQDLDGRPLVVNEARPRADRGPRGGGFGGGGGGFGGGGGSFRPPPPPIKRGSGKGSRRGARRAKRERKAFW
jgi:RNA recognition motif-containing protein